MAHLMVDSLELLKFLNSLKRSAKAGLAGDGVFTMSDAGLDLAWAGGGQHFRAL